MKKYVCSVCGYVYDEATGIPGSGIAPGTTWDMLPDDWVCPLCGAIKNEFTELSEVKQAAPTVPKAPDSTPPAETMQELSPGALAALCSNLSKGCEKQYLPEEAALFARLSDYYAARTTPPAEVDLSELALLVQKDLEQGYPAANALAENDRGALRALTWNEKVSRILSSLLARYERQKTGLLENAGVFVCEICGFVYVGDNPPEICPVCKVPNLKIRMLQGGNE